MPPSAKLFAERLNQCLNETGAPVNVRERAIILGRMIDISKQQAWSLLEGQQLPQENLIEMIAKEFDVDSNWLSGDNKK